MLLPVERASCFRDMDKVSFFALDILRFVESEGNNPFDEKHFLAQFNNSGDWFLNKVKDGDGKVQKGLKQLYKLTIQERVILREAFEHDIVFAKSIGLNFEFNFRRLDQRILNIAKDFLVPFYDNIFAKSGFREIDGLEAENIPLGRKTFLQHYKKANPETYQLCPACLLELKLLVTRGKEEVPVASVDHYLPKSLYPVLVVSPENLIPVCSDCNERLKGRTNPIDEKKSRLLSCVFFPYHDPGLNQIQIEFSLSKETVIVKPKDPSDMIVKTKIDNMERLFKTSKVWSGSFKLVHKELIQRAKHLIPQNMITDTELIKFLEKEKEISSEGAYTMPRNFLMMSYCEWLLKNNRDLQVLKQYLDAV